jgi:hypothetical protein
LLNFRYDDGTDEQRVLRRRGMADMKRTLLVALLCASLVSSAQGSTAFDPPTSQQYTLVNRVNYIAKSAGGSVYTNMASLTLTLGTSAGPTGAWEVEVSFQPSLVTANSYTLCITGTNAGSSGVGSYDQANTAVCANAPANPLAGGSSNSAQAAYIVRYSAQYANGATVAFLCRLYSTTAVLSVSGYCNERAFPI